MTIIVKRREVLIGVGLGALTACAPTRQTPRDSSLAEGTTRPAEGGVGGTGIVGILHGTGSLLVNGLRIVTPAGVPVRDALGPRRLEELAIGHALTIEAVEDADGRLVARSVVVDNPLVGPIEALRDDGFSCLGVEVRLEPGAPLVRPDGSRFVPLPGQRVAVCGLWQGDRVVAARLDLVEAGDAPDVVAGAVMPGAGPGAVRLGALDLAMPARVAAPPPGSFVTAIGRRDGDRLLVERLEEGRFQGLAGPLTRLSIEGYLEPIDAAPGFTVSGLGHSFDEAVRLARLAGVRALFVGPYDGRFRAQSALPLPEAVSTRGALLGAVEDGFAPEGSIPTR